MKWKEFLRPSYSKIILTVALLVIAFLYVHPTMMGVKSTISTAEVHYRGLPFPYYKCTTEIFPNTEPFTHCDFEVGPNYFPYLNLVLDILILYFISCLMLWMYGKVKKKK